MPAARLSQCLENTQCCQVDELLLCQGTDSRATPGRGSRPLPVPGGWNQGKADTGEERAEGSQKRGGSAKSLWTEFQGRPSPTTEAKPAARPTLPCRPQSAGAEGPLSLALRKVPGRTSTSDQEQRPETRPEKCSSCHLGEGEACSGEEVCHRGQEGKPREWVPGAPEERTKWEVEGLDFGRTLLLAGWWGDSSDLAEALAGSGDNGRKCPSPPAGESGRK
uniref:Uncharacterized protein n=1 Tax=Rangifer tarandus platyrhynchus TaxID=3082113 RepID=A0ACB0E454_RANTA|nr:unnamed protein product [Rangifer tarandus platyrhynchus]